MFGTTTTSSSSNDKRQLPDPPGSVFVANNNYNTTKPRRRWDRFACVLLCLALGSLLYMDASIIDIGSATETTKTKTETTTDGLSPHDPSSSNGALNETVGSGAVANTGRAEAIGAKHKTRDYSSSSSSSRETTKFVPPSKMKVHYHEMWNHRTSTIDVPEEYKHPFDEWVTVDSENDENKRRPRTSLEILQDVLHGSKYEAEFAALEGYLNYTAWERLAKTEDLGSPPIQKVDPPSCLVADLRATGELAAGVVAARKNETRQRLRQRQRRRSLFVIRNVEPGDDWPYRELVLPLPVLNVGFPKVGSNTITDFFGCIGLNADHGQQGRLMFENLDNGRPLFSGIGKKFPVHAQTQLDFNVQTGFYPQVSLLDELHEVFPEATMVFLFRPIADWIVSTAKWNAMKHRFGKFRMPGLELTEAQLDRLDLLDSLNQTTIEKAKRVRHIPLTDLQIAKWWCGHVLHLREFVREHPSHALVELDLYDSESTSALLYDLFQADTDAHSGNTHSPNGTCWGHSNKWEDKDKNKNKKEKNGAGGNNYKEKRKEKQKKRGIGGKNSNPNK